MRIGLVGTSIYGQGAEYVLAAIARGLSLRGHDVDVIVSGVNKIIAEEDRAKKPFDIGKSALLIELNACRGRWSIVELAKILKNRKHDVIMCHAEPFAIPTVIARILSGTKAKIVYVQHLGGVGTDLKGNRVEKTFSLRTIFVNWIMRLFDAQFAVSQGTLEAIHRMTGYPNDKLFLVNNPVFEKEEVNNACNEMPTHPWLSNSGVPVVAAAGAFGGLKNYDLLIRAFALVRKQIDCRLVIFGDGPFRSHYMDLINELGIADFVSLPGFSNQLRRELRGAACFVVSSFIESFSIVLVEALACGVPVVSTDAPYGPREILADGKYGILVKNNNLEELARGILRVLKGEGIRPETDMLVKYQNDVVAADYESKLMAVMDKR